VGSVGVGGFGSGGGIVAAPGWGLSGFAPGSKSSKEVWKVVNELGLPLRVARSRSTLDEQNRGRDHDQRARGVGIRTGVEGEFERRTQGKVRLLCLGVESRRFRLLRAQGKVAESEVWEEKSRRKEMAALRKELYGGGVGKEGRLSLDPEWDDVVPIVLQEPEKALAAIAYPQDYAEGEFVSEKGLCLAGSS
jgi:protein farnesyltransferase/geranylgeranyltransferase type-1 subunit alpha